MPTLNLVLAKNSVRVSSEQSSHRVRCSVLSAFMRGAVPVTIHLHSASFGMQGDAVPPWIRDLLAAFAASISHVRGKATMDLTVECGHADVGETDGL